VAPGVALSGDVIVADRVYISSTVRLGSTSSGPDFSSGIDLAVGGSQQLQYFVWGAGVGPIFIPVTSLVAGEIITAGDEVSFESAWLTGVGLKAFVEYGDFRGGLSFQWAENHRGRLGDVEYKVSNMKIIDAHPFGRLTVESTSRETGLLLEDTSLVYLVESGLIWSF
jgi:hypothetical protein